MHPLVSLMCIINPRQWRCVISLQGWKADVYLITVTLNHLEILPLHFPLESLIFPFYPKWDAVIAAVCRAWRNTYSRTMKLFSYLARLSFSLCFAEVTLLKPQVWGPWHHDTCKLQWFHGLKHMLPWPIICTLNAPLAVSRTTVENKLNDTAVE